jgi:hypothetical protein
VVGRAAGHHITIRRPTAFQQTLFQIVLEGPEKEKVRRRNMENASAVVQK